MSTSSPEPPSPSAQPLAILRRLGTVLTSTLKLQQLLQVVMELIADLFQPQDWSLLLVDEQRGELYFAIVVGEAGERLKALRLKLGEGIAGWVAQHGEPLTTIDAYNDERFAQWVDRRSGFTTHSIVCLPLVSKGRTLGVIELLNISPSRWTDERFELLHALADFAAVAIENASYVEQIERLTIVDDVTDLYNARHLHAALDEELARARRYALPLSAIFLDLDHFKRINDGHDHLVGSRLLREVGQLFRRGLRAVDFAARYGGDEFVLVLPNTDKRRAVTVAQRLRRTLNGKTFLRRQGLELRVTASFGVATFPDDADSKEALLRAADQAMYRVKNSSRDGVGVAEPRQLAGGS